MVDLGYYLMDKKAYIAEISKSFRSAWQKIIELNDKELFKDSPDFDEQVALENMKSFFPKLKRWA